ncbi:hypothetical protein DOTSEDRAFT_68613 [Lecanosticta acicola]|uniref:F-box domain-containing protein n=1 Tax=Lecanosticta acicola TaxID=111012 RepID=A0AAI8YWP7_9PEZI|nr:hypothetical protein DOTSEDRAFT_68613 [Lecanosticta acicola]
MSILKLPTELLDEVFSYLDWDRSEYLYPTKPDIINASLSCRELREALIPSVFRDVVLRLRWAGGQLVEPRLYTLRTEHPELARHIRCVYIRTEYEQCQHCAERGDPQPFTVPQNVHDWLNPSGSAGSLPVGQAGLRTRADALAAKMLQVEEGQASCLSSKAEELVLRSKQGQQSPPEIDALAIVMLCIPACTTTLVFKSLTNNVRMASRDRFAHRLLSTALRLLGDRLQDLTTVTTSVKNPLGMSRHQRQPRILAKSIEDFDGITGEIVQNLHLHRLSFALSDEAEMKPQTYPPDLFSAGYSRWHQAADNVRELNICYVRAEARELLQLLKGFHSLQRLSFRDCVLRVQSNALPAPRQVRFEAQQNVWLLFAIELRQALQHVKIHMRDIRSHGEQAYLTPSTVAWLLSQAVPPGALIDADREERLMQDFGSFLPLWLAEDSERGAAAAEDWVNTRAALSDTAMSRRWR